MQNFLVGTSKMWKIKRSHRRQDNWRQLGTHETTLWRRRWFRCTVRSNVYYDVLNSSKRKWILLQDRNDRLLGIVAQTKKGGGNAHQWQWEHHPHKQNTIALQAPELPHFVWRFRIRWKTNQAVQFNASPVQFLLPEIGGEPDKATDSHCGEYRVNLACVPLWVQGPEDQANRSVGEHVRWGWFNDEVWKRDAYSINP
jgi:hypothetical protein